MTDAAYRRYRDSPLADANPSFIKALLLALIVALLVVDFLYTALTPEPQRLQLRLATSYERDSSDILIDQPSSEDEGGQRNANVTTSFAVTKPVFARSWSNAFNIYSIDRSNPELVYKIRGPPYTQRFQQPNGKFIMTMEEHILSFLSTFAILDQNGQVLGEITEGFFNLLPTHHVSVYENNASYELREDLVFSNYWMRNSRDEIVAKVLVHGGFFARRYYQIHAARGMDSLLVLASSIAVINDVDDRASSSSSSSSSSSGTRSLLRKRRPQEQMKPARKSSL